MRLWGQHSRQEGRGSCSCQETCVRRGCAGIVAILLMTGIARGQSESLNGVPPSTPRSTQRYSQGFQPLAPVNEYYPDAATQHLLPPPAAVQGGDILDSSKPLAVPQNAQREPVPAALTGELSAAFDPTRFGTAFVPENAGVPDAVLPTGPAAGADPSGALAIPLSRPGSGLASSGENSRKKIGSTSSQLGLTVVVLGGILAVLIVLARLLKKHVPQVANGLPSEALELLGRKMIDQRHAVHYLRIGQRILIVGASLDGLRTLAEITDPVEVDLISGQCRTLPRESSLTRSFNMLLSRQSGEVAPVNLDREHRERQRAQRKPQPTAASMPTGRSTFDWETPGSVASADISPQDIEELTRTLQAARQRSA